MFSKTVSGALAKLTKIITDLEDVATKQKAEVERQQAIMDYAQVARAEATTETATANRIAEKLRDLLS